MSAQRLVGRLTVTERTFVGVYFMTRRAPNHPNAAPASDGSNGRRSNRLVWMTTTINLFR